GDRRAHEREEYGAVTHGRKLDRDLIEPPGKGAPDHEDSREGIDRLAPLGRFACRAHACSSSLSATALSKPSRFQLWRMCCGRGAVTSILPPSGCGMTIRRACRWSRFWIPPGSSQLETASKYLGSPRIGQPMCAA